MLEGNEEGAQKWLLEYMSRRLGGGGALKKSNSSVGMSLVVGVIFTFCELQ